MVGSVGLAGLTAIKPGEVRVVQLFGGYRGTVRTTGLRWVNPFAVRRRVSVRIRNKETPTVKVNDADGNPIEIAAVVVWQVRDSARATYGVEDFVAFVDTQSETALRHVANGHPYDNAGSDVTVAARPHRRGRRPAGRPRSRPGSSPPASTSSRPGSPGCPTRPRSPR